MEMKRRTFMKHCSQALVGLTGCLCTTKALAINKKESGDSGGANWHGQIDHALIHNRALSPQEIDCLYKDHPLIKGLANCWLFDEGSARKI